MRTLRIVLGTVGAGPALTVALLPAAEGCGQGSSTESVSALDGSIDAASGKTDADAGFSLGDSSTPLLPDAAWNDCTQGQGVTHTVPLPPPGVMADTAIICAVNTSPVVSNVAARVTISNLVPLDGGAAEGGAMDLGTAKGHITVPAALLGSIIGTPQVVVSGGLSVTITNVAPASDGFAFDITPPPPHPRGSPSASRPRWSSSSTAARPRPWSRPPRSTCAGSTRSACG